MSDHDDCSLLGTLPPQKICQLSMVQNESVSLGDTPKWPLGTSHEKPLDFGVDNPYILFILFVGHWSQNHGDNLKPKRFLRPAPLAAGLELY